MEIGPHIALALKKIRNHNSNERISLNINASQKAKIPV
jgi:hypothetical protein